MINSRLEQAHAVVRQRTRSRNHLWMAVIMASLFIACGPYDLVLTITEDDRVQIYSAIIHKIYNEDDTFGGELRPPVLFVLKSTDDRAGGASAELSESIVLSMTIQDDVSAMLAAVPTEFGWVDSTDDVVDPDTRGVIRDGALITLGNIRLQNDGSVQAAGSIFVGFLAAGGRTYVLRSINGIWKIVGDTGSFWIS